MTTGRGVTISVGGRVEVTKGGAEGISVCTETVTQDVKHIERRIGINIYFVMGYSHDDHTILVRLSFYSMLSSENRREGDEVAVDVLSCEGGLCRQALDARANRRYGRRDPA